MYFFINTNLVRTMLRAPSSIIISLRFDLLELKNILKEKGLDFKIYVNKC